MEVVELRNNATSNGTVRSAFRTPLGEYLIGDISEILDSNFLKPVKGKVQLILTSPPFPLNNKKQYGNHVGEEYLEWIISLAPRLSELLTEDGSIVLEIGNSWEPGRPIQSLLPLQSLMGFVQEPTSNLRLIQEFVSYNPSRLPSPAQWVTVNRFRTVDSYTHVWWMAKSDTPKADNRNVLRPYSKSMSRLIEKQSFNAGRRPSGHKISERGFLKDNGGSIAHNFFELDPMSDGRGVRLPNAFSFSNTSSNDFFNRECKRLDITPHPARMPTGLASFFVEFLTGPGDIVFDPFAGSNTTGFAAEQSDRRWISADIHSGYSAQAKLRFDDPGLKRKAEA